MDWSQLFQFGVPTALLAAGLWFTVKHIWPFVVRAWETQSEERRQEREKFLETVNSMMKTFESISRSERDTRIDERNRFLAALEQHNRHLADVVEAQEELRQAIDSNRRDK